MKELLQSNPQQFQSTIYQSTEKKEGKEEDESDNFLDYNFTQEQILDNFDFVLSQKERTIKKQNRTSIGGKNICLNVQFNSKKISSSTLKRKTIPDEKLD